MTQTAAEVFRNYVTAGVPGSGVNQPAKAEISAWGTYLESLLNGSAAGLAYATVALLNADLAHAANILAIVYGDSTPANNGMYVKVGASGSGSWSRIGDLANGIVRLTVTGGTGDAIIATSPETPTVPGAKLYLLMPTAANTVATTIVVNGVAAVPIKNAFGIDLAAGSLINGSQVLMAWQVDHYQLLISAVVDGTAILASVVASASAAATSASSAASSASALGNQVHQYDTRALAIAATIPTGVQAIKITRYATGYPLAYATYIPGSSSGPMAFQEAGGHWWQLDLSGAVFIPEWFGAIGDGTTDNLAAVNACLASLPAAGGCIEFGIGKYLFSANVAKTMTIGFQTISIKGQGIDATTLYWPAGGGLTLTNTNTNNYVSIHDMTFTTGAAGVGNGLKLGSTGAALAFGGVNRLYNLSFRGSDYTSNTNNSFYWANAINILNWCNVNIDNCTTAGLCTLTFGSAGGGTGLIYGGIASNICGVVNVTNCTFFYHSVYVQLNDWWEGVTFTNCCFLGQVGSVGLNVPSGSHTGPLLQIIGCQFNVSGLQIDIATSVVQIILIGNTITNYGNNSFGALLGMCSNVIVNGNMFNSAFGTNLTALSINGNNGVVTGNVIVNMTNGISLGALSTDINVSQNAYAAVTTHVVNAGSGNSVGVATN